VGSVIGFATRKVFVPIRYPALMGASMGAGMALERYSYQLRYVIQIFLEKYAKIT